MCHGMHVEVMDNLEGVHFLLPPRGSQGLDEGCQAWQQATEPSQWLCWLVQNASLLWGQTMFHILALIWPYNLCD